MARRYKVRAGIHVHGGKTYNKGDVVVTERDLVKEFPEKFDDVGPAELAAPRPSPAAPPPPPPPPSLPPAQKEEEPSNAPSSPKKVRGSSRRRKADDAPDGWQGGE